jgi:RimJ/RimL family protein N-acetyltransferase
MNILETERLTIREFSVEDAAFIFELMNSPLYIKNIGDRNIESIDEAENFIKNRLIDSYQEYGYGLYAVVLTGTNVLIGMSGLVNRADLPHVDIGFAFLPAYMGKGYAYESSKAVMDHAKQTLELDPILAITIKENAPSIKLLHKLGLHYEETIKWGEEQEEIMLLSTASH